MSVELGELALGLALTGLGAAGAWASRQPFGRRWVHRWIENEGRNDFQAWLWNRGHRSETRDETIERIARMTE